jgi:hypothetical protein
MKDDDRPFTAVGAVTHASSASVNGSAWMKPSGHVVLPFGGRLRSVRARVPQRKAAAWLPREHGFWVMSCAIALSSSMRHPRWLAGVVAVALLGSAALIGGRLRRYVRRSAWLQLSAALVLAACGIPIEVAAGRAPHEAVLDALAWGSVFAAFTLGVWACNARSSRRRRSRALPFTVLSVVVPACATFAFVFAESRARAVATVSSAITMLAFALWRPGAKQMKRVGMSLGVCAGIVGILLMLG